MDGIRPFSDLEKKCMYRIKEVENEALRNNMDAFNVHIDKDSPIGANDYTRCFVAFVDGDVIYMDYDRG